MYFCCHQVLRDNVLYATSQVEVAYHAKVIDCYQQKLKLCEATDWAERTKIYRTILSNIDKILEYGNVDLWGTYEKLRWHNKRKEVQDAINEIGNWQGLLPGTEASASESELLATE